MAVRCLVGRLDGSSGCWLLGCSLLMWADVLVVVVVIVVFVAYITGVCCWLLDVGCWLLVVA